MFFAPLVAWLRLSQPFTPLPYHVLPPLKPLTCVFALRAFFHSILMSLCTSEFTKVIRVTLVLPYFALWLVQKLANQAQTKNQSRLGRPRFSRVLDSLVVLYFDSSLSSFFFLFRFFFFREKWLKDEPKLIPFKMQLMDLGQPLKSFQLKLG